MARFYLISIAFVLLSSCGQVGTITGGDKDNAAPKILVDEVQPPIGSINTAPKKITIPFDEYIEFNQPSDNIKVTPADVQLDYSIKGKSVVLDVKEGSWKPNTTYTIYLNRAVKDITEYNDSIIAYVFSTGNYLDSLKTAIQVMDAYTGKPAKKVTVGLYNSVLVNDTSAIEPRYYAATNEEGIAFFQNIKDSVFYAYAFEDDNINNRLDATEKRAYLADPVQLDTSFEVGPIIRLMPHQENEIKVNNSEVIPAVNWCIGFNRPINQNEKFNFLDPQPKYVQWNKKRDSLTAFYKTKENSVDFKGVLIKKNNSDTLTKKHFFKEERTLKVKNNLNNKVLSPNDTLKLMFNEPIHKMDRNAIQSFAYKTNDSTKSEIPLQIDSLSVNTLSIKFNKKDIEKVEITLLPQSIEGINNTLSDSLKIDFTLQSKKETGSLIVAFDTLPKYGILYLTKDKKVVRKAVFNGIDKTEHQFNFLQPGRYGYHYLIDTDKNGVWSTGSIFENIDAEKIIWFSEKSQVRANWEVKKSLTLAQPKKKIIDIETK
ncbi:hypothetical protein CW751_01660 [Brumimicrobium salinarum]|uniref:SbsA Ig-like domain-containing protein n=1 Tax=Brumimicrobium salinarum TaxID=2058658 RepID=A0A2I0R677_9FLAO|nr:Ig-like domain-containing protein [Brumimicrobium salinarum]PKR82069.1 hypothetical protein CW751_01660 [Brumimicrobium salinarum]